MILIFCEQEDVRIGLPAGHFGGEQVCVPNPNASRRLDGTDTRPPAPVVLGSRWVSHRAYSADGRFLAVDGEDAEQVSIDAALILAMPGFRLASASEQNAYTATAAQQSKNGGGAGAIKESGGGKAAKAVADKANGG